MTEWKQCRKKPVIVEFREVEPKEYFVEGRGYNSPPCEGEVISTLEGNLKAIVGEDFIIRGVNGEIYPIKKSIFRETYDMLETPHEAYVKMKEAEK